MMDRIEMIVSLLHSLKVWQKEKKSSMPTEYL